MCAVHSTRRAGGSRSAIAGRAVLAVVCAGAMAASLAAEPSAIAGLAAAALVPVLAAIAVIDARWYLIPDTLNAAGLALGLVHAAAVALDPLDGVLTALARGWCWRFCSSPSGSDTARGAGVTGWASAT
ncbi:hypothetical protein EZH22_24110 [Xanthobacter dioxanivorans]|uniref:Uncharacterized protein n=1 Tax=Xanthobacter dioxanivorans TaxID=2528964 RepID=A0A974PMJ3_9HYPH|nr:hypothetical protein [Xanthobacter dioxanivorans]QRG06048.1 hypothetical protein EZH22_24110 [Xanthobacter dioxanivorans]